MDGTRSLSRRCDASSRLLDDLATLGRVVARERTSATSRLEGELGSELATRLVAALGRRQGRRFAAAR